MSAMRSVFHIAKADFLERSRRFGFLVMLAATVYIGYLFVPEVGAGYQTVTLGQARGVYNSPWIGAMFGLMVSTTLSIFAFYLINNALRRDRKTRVGEIVASTPVSKPVYILGKWLSNFAVLAVIMAVLTLAGMGMQYFRAEDTHLRPFAVMAPLWMIGLPVMAVIAALAVLFESVSFLSGGFGNIVYFFVWMGFFVPTMFKMTNDSTGMIISFNDFFGISRVIRSMQETIRLLDPTYNGNFGIGVDEFTHNPLIFVWEGMRWTLPLIIERLAWTLLGPAIALVAALPFERFDPARRKAAQSSITEAQAEESNGENMITPVAPIHTLTPLAKRRSRGRFLTVLWAEFRLMLWGQSWWWYIIAVGLTIASAVTPPDISPILLAVSWLWPILVWSPMGVRELRHDTHEVIFSTPKVLVRQLAAMWLSGVLVALLISSGGLSNALAAGQSTRAGMIMVGACFVPALALALGAWSRSSRLFEVTYLLLWYLALNGLGALDFMGLGLAVAPPNLTMIYVGLTGLLLIVSVIGRAQQFQR